MPLKSQYRAVHSASIFSSSHHQLHICSHQTKTNFLRQKHIPNLKQQQIWDLSGKQKSSTSLSSEVRCPSITTRLALKTNSSGGIAGNVVAGRLAENPNVSILVIEAGIG
jgi:hypothetical protein